MHTIVLPTRFHRTIITFTVTAATLVGFTVSSQYGWRWTESDVGAQIRTWFVCGNVNKRREKGHTDRPNMFGARATAIIWLHTAYENFQNQYNMLLTALNKIFWKTFHATKDVFKIQRHVSTVCNDNINFASQYINSKCAEWPYSALCTSYSNKYFKTKLYDIAASYIFQPNIKKKSCSIRKSIGGEDLFSVQPVLFNSHWLRKCVRGMMVQIAWSIDTCALGCRKATYYTTHVPHPHIGTQIQARTQCTLVKVLPGPTNQATNEPHSVSSSDLPYYFVIENNKLYIHCICVSIASYMIRWCSRIRSRNHLSNAMSKGLLLLLRYASNQIVHP